MEKILSLTSTSVVNSSRTKDSNAEPEDLRTGLIRFCKEHEDKVMDVNLQTTGNLELNTYLEVLVFQKRASR